MWGKGRLVVLLIVYWLPSVVEINNDSFLFSSWMPAASRSLATRSGTGVTVEKVKEGKLLISSEGSL
jgi:hypothetical protein